MSSAHPPAVHARPRPFFLVRRGDTGFARATVGGVSVAVVELVPPAGAQQGPVTVVMFDMSRLRLLLHAGFTEPPGSTSWQPGPQVSPSERVGLVAAFNGGFKMADSRGGWVSQGRTAVPLVTGAASVVAYTNGKVNIGAWGQGLPDPRLRVRSVRQNLQLLVNHGRPQDVNPPSPLLRALLWGTPFRGAQLVSRSALGVTANGDLVWVAGTNVTVAALASALVRHGAVRAMELDINAPFVRGFLYPGTRNTVSQGHAHLRAPLPLVVGQTQPAYPDAFYAPSTAQWAHCTYLGPCSRDFFTILAR